MRAKRCLERLKEMDEAVGRLVREQTMLRRMSLNENPIKIDALLEEARALSPQIEKAYQELERYRKQMSHQLERLPDPEERKALHLHYFKFMRIFEIAYVLNYSDRHIFRLLKRGLMHLEALLDGYDEESRPEA